MSISRLVLLNLFAFYLFRFNHCSLLTRNYFSLAIIVGDGEKVPIHKGGRRCANEDMRKAGFLSFEKYLKKI